MSRPPAQPGVLPQPYAMQLASTATPSTSFVDTAARMREGRRMNGPAVPLPMPYYVPGELVATTNTNTNNNNVWKERRLMTAMHSGSGLDFALGEDRELKELTNITGVAVAASSTASSLAMPTHAACIPVRHLPASPSASALQLPMSLQAGRPAVMAREPMYPTGISIIGSSSSTSTAAALGGYASNGRAAGEGHTSQGSSASAAAARRANWRTYAGPQPPRSGLDATTAAAAAATYASQTCVQQQQQQPMSLQAAHLPASRHTRARPAALLSPQGSLLLAHNNNNSNYNASNNNNNNSSCGSYNANTASMLGRSDEGSRLRVANTNTTLPLSACPAFGPPPPPRLPSLSLSLSNHVNNGNAPSSAREQPTLSCRRPNAEPSTGRTSCCGPGSGGHLHRGSLSPARPSPRAPTMMTARSQSSSRHSGAVLSTVPRHFTLLERQRVWQEVERYEQHLHYPKITLSAEALNNGDSEERRRRLEQRYKQVLYGKDTDGYRKYRLIVPTVGEREYHNPMHPVTPRPENDCSKRAFDKYLNAWRRQLHQWDNCDVANIAPEYRPLGTATLADLGLADRGSLTVPSLPVPPPSNNTAAGAAGAPLQLLTRPAAFRPVPGPRIMQSIANAALPAAGTAREGLTSVLASQQLPTSNNNNNTNNMGSNNASEVWTTHGGEKSPSFFFHTSRMTPGAAGGGGGGGGTSHVMALNSARLLSSAAETPSRQDGPVLDFNFFANGTPSRQESPLNYMNSILYQALHNGHPSPTATHVSMNGSAMLEGTAATTTTNAGLGKTARTYPAGTANTNNTTAAMAAAEGAMSGCGDGCTAGPMVTLLRNEFDLISPFSARASPAGPGQPASALPTQDERGGAHGGSANALDAAPLGVAATLETWAQLPAIYYPSAAGPHSLPRH